MLIAILRIPLGEGDVIFNRVAIIQIERKRVLVQTCRQSHPSVCRSVCVSAWRAYCGKTADWIWMLFRVVSEVSRGMGVLNGVEIVEGERAVWGIIVGHLIVTNGDFVAYSLPRRVATGCAQITLEFLVSDKYETDEVCEPSTSPERSARQRITGEKRAHVHRKWKTSRVEIVGQIMKLQANQQQVNPLMHKVAKMVT